MPARFSPQRLRPGVAGRAGIALLAAFAAWNAAPPAVADLGVVRQLLDRMVRASHSLDYIGTFVYRSGSTIQSMKIIHRAGTDGSRERLVALSGSAREVIRDGQRVTCILPDDRIIVVARRRPGTLYPSTAFEPEIKIDSGIGEIYALESGGVARVADREANVIDVRPKDRYRYGFRLALGRETGLLLKLELLDADSTVLEEIVYTHLELPSTIPDEALKPHISHAGFTRYEADALEDSSRDPAARPQEWEIGWLPAGFTMADESYGPIQPGRDSVDHRVYSDGLASLSIFIEREPDPDDRMEGASSVGAVSAFSRVIGEYQLSVVGEVPGITVEKIAASIVKQ